MAEVRSVEDPKAARVAHLRAVIRDLLQKDPSRDTDRRIEALVAQLNEATTP